LFSLVNLPMINDICSWKPNCNDLSNSSKIKVLFYQKYLCQYDPIRPGVPIKTAGGLLKFLISVSIECPQ
jgi:hypothetical protein